jgi:uncharacterized membrane protein SpoIIM required for sporulation
MRIAILFATLMYIIGVVIGFQIDPVLAEPVNTGSFAVWDIAKNNFSVVTINIAGGMSFGVISVVNTIYNGFILGYSLSVVSDYIAWDLIFKHFLPHSIEIIGIILSCALGLKIAFYVFKLIFNKGAIEFKQTEFTIYLIVTIFIIVLAAILEFYISMS